LSVRPLSVRGLSKTFGAAGSARALDSIDFTVERGELLVLLGPSGCGKTTLLRCLAGLEQPDSGTIELGGELVFDSASKLAVPTHRRDIGMVFQNYALWPHMTVGENVRFPLESRRRGDAASRVAELLRTVRCEGLEDRFPGQLSGGQQQRVALARALAARPAVMLMDEPLSNLDALLRADLRRELRHIHREVGYTGVYVTHDQMEAMQLGSRVAVMREGSLEQIATPEEVYRRPLTDYVAGFLGISNHLPVNAGEGGIVGGFEAHGQTSLDGRAQPGAVVFFRPEDASLRTPNGSVSSSALEVVFRGGRVVERLFSGGLQAYVIEGRDGSKVVSTVPSQRRDSWSVGDSVDVVLAAADMLVYRDGRLVEDR
jgi:iron(III) transport system ATP-binding protein